MNNQLTIADKIETEGIIGYHEGARAYNTIRLPKQLIEQFPQLKDKKLRIFFKIQFFKNYSDLKKNVWEMEYSNKQAPLILYFYYKNAKE